jgi:hypothetical protein
MHPESAWKKIWRREMNHSEEGEFIQMVRDDYSGHVKVEILFDLRSEKRLGFLEGRCAVSIKLLLGKPKIIGWSLEYPVELPAFGIYDPNHDGKMRSIFGFRDDFKLSRISSIDSRGVIPPTCRKRRRTRCWNRPKSYRQTGRWHS